MTSPALAKALHEEALLQVQVDTIERCESLISDRVTVFDARRQLMRFKGELQHKLAQVRHSVDTEAPTRKDGKVIT